jgi:hypothetical protein
MIGMRKTKPGPLTLSGLVLTIRTTMRSSGWTFRIGDALM